MKIDYVFSHGYDEVAVLFTFSQNNYYGLMDRSTAKLTRVEPFGSPKPMPDVWVAVLNARFAKQLQEAAVRLCRV